MSGQYYFILKGISWQVQTYDESCLGWAQAVMSKTCIDTLMRACTYDTFIISLSRELGGTFTCALLYPHIYNGKKKCVNSFRLVFYIGNNVISIYVTIIYKHSTLELISYNVSCLVKNKIRNVYRGEAKEIKGMIKIEKVGI